MIDHDGSYDKLQFYGEGVPEIAWRHLVKPRPAVDTYQALLSIGRIVSLMDKAFSYRSLLVLLLPRENATRLINNTLQSRQADWRLTLVPGALGRCFQVSPCS
jgi:hypothetical protein